MRCVKCEHPIESHVNGCSEIEGQIDKNDKICGCNQTEEENSKQINKNKDRKSAKLK